MASRYIWKADAVRFSDLLEVGREMRETGDCEDGSWVPGVSHSVKPGRRAGLQEGEACFREI